MEVMGQEKEITWWLPQDDLIAGEKKRMKGKQVGKYNFKIILQNQIKVSLFCQIQEVVNFLFKEIQTHRECSLQQICSAQSYRYFKSSLQHLKCLFFHKTSQ